MPISIDPEWQQLALYAVGAAILLILLFNIPFVGRLLRTLFSVGVLALGLFLLFQHAPFDPNLARLSQNLGLDGQQVTGDEIRIRMSPDGHSWARARINGVERRMLVDSGASITALSERTAQQASIEASDGVIPVVLQTANGAVKAQTGKIERLEVGSIIARDLNVVVSPGLGPVDILGMNFLSQLASWRVEGRTLILTPAKAKPEA